jgi:hypothetical protein
VLIEVVMMFVVELLVEVVLPVELLEVVLLLEVFVVDFLDVVEVVLLELLFVVFLEEAVDVVLLEEIIVVLLDVIVAGLAGVVMAFVEVVMGLAELTVIDGCRPLSGRAHAAWKR